MSKLNIKSHRIGYTNVFLIGQDNRCLIIDTGSRGEIKKLVNFINSSGFDTKAVEFIFLTHTHYDHAGSAAALKQISGAKIIVHNSEQVYLSMGFKEIPKGTSFLFKIISRFGKVKPSIEKRVGGYEPVVSDMIFEDELSLKNYGYDATIHHTPGHTVGSSSLIINDQAFVGDCMFNLRGSLYPGFADDEIILRDTWKKMMQWDVERFFPAHGKPFSKNELLDFVHKKKIV